MRGNRRGFRRWFWIVLAALPFVVWLAGQSLARQSVRPDWIAGKIQRRPDLETRVGGASVSPWSGVCICRGGAAPTAPAALVVSDPFARIATSVSPPSGAHGCGATATLRAVELDSPQFVIPVELLADLAKSQDPYSPSRAAGCGRHATVRRAARAAPAAPPPPVAPRCRRRSRHHLPPTAWLHLKNASFTVLSAVSGKPWFDVSGLSGSIPVAGSPAESTLRLAPFGLAATSRF